MTLVDYAAAQLVGSGARPTPNENHNTIRRWQRTENAIAHAEAEVVAIASQHTLPANQRESKENTAGMMLALSTMVANYAFCFPVVVTRHRLQAFSNSQSWRRDTPSRCSYMLRHSYRTGGLRALYAGFEYGLFGQLLSAAYETLLGEAMRMLRKTKHPLRYVAQGLGKCLAFAILIPLYPLNRNSLILRVQSVDQPRITGHREFLQCYLRDLSRFLPGRSYEKHSGALPLSSVFLTSCIINTLSERTHLYLYRRIYHATTVDKSLRKKKSHRRLRHGDSRKSPTMLHAYYPEIACGVVSSIITRAISYPIDTVLFKLMVQDSQLSAAGHTSYTGFWDCVRRTWQDGGLGAFFPGWGAGILEAGFAYVILESSWYAYRAVDQSFERSSKMQRAPNKHSQDR